MCPEAAPIQSDNCPDALALVNSLKNQDGNKRRTPRSLAKARGAKRGKQEPHKSGIITASLEGV
jgi:hypothetical protein